MSATAVEDPGSGSRAWTQTILCGKRARRLVLCRQSVRLVEGGKVLLVELYGKSENNDVSRILLYKDHNSNLKKNNGCGCEWDQRRLDEQ